MATPLTISKGGTHQFSPHFNEAELYSNSSDAPASHPFYPQLVAALEWLRVHFGTSWRVTSTFRTEAHERKILAAAGTPFFVDEHMKGKAVDSQPANNDPAILAAIAADWLAQGPIYQALRQLGITGFGLYDTFIHLDCRDSNFTAKRRDSWGLVACWDSRKRAAKGTARFGGTAFVSQKKSVAQTTQTTRPVLRSASSLNPSPSTRWPVVRRPGPGSSSR